MSTLVAYCSCIKKLDLGTVYPLQPSAVPPQLDKALTQAYVFMKNKGYSPEAFWSLYEDRADLVTQSEAVQKLLKVEGSWAGHEASICAVVASSSLGKKMFGFAEEWLAVYGIGEIMQNRIKDILGGQALTMQLIEKCRFAMKADLDGRSHVAKLALEKPRTVEVQYRGAEIKVVVAGLGRNSMCAWTST